MWALVQQREVNLMSSILNRKSSSSVVETHHCPPVVLSFRSCELLGKSLEV